MQAPIESNGWRFEDAVFVVVRDGLKQLIGRNLFEVIGISITQTLCSDEDSMVNTVTTQCPFKNTHSKSVFSTYLTHWQIKSSHC